MRNRSEQCFAAAGIIGLSGYVPLATDVLFQRLGLMPIATAHGLSFVLVFCGCLSAVAFAMGAVIERAQ
jgi:hypothetical protein